MKLIEIPDSFWGWPAPPPEELKHRSINPSRIHTVSADRDGMATIEFADGRVLHSISMRAGDLLDILTTL